MGTVDVQCDESSPQHAQTFPEGPAVKLASLAGRHRFSGAREEERGRALPLCLNGDGSWADCLFGEGGVNGTHKSIKSIRVLCRDGLALAWAEGAWPDPL